MDNTTVNSDDDLLVGFPSEDFPGPPPFRFRIPSNWRAVPTPSAEAVVISDVEIDGVRPNAVIRWHRVSPVEAPGSLLNGLMQAELASHGLPEPEAKAAPEAKSLTATFVRDTTPEESPEESATIAQMFGLHYFPGKWIAFILAVSGTFAPTSEPSHQQVKQVLGSIQV